MLLESKVEGLFPELRKRVLDGSLDFYIGPIIEHPLPRDLVVEKLLNSELVILGRKGHPLCTARWLFSLVGASWTGFSLAGSGEIEPNPCFQKYGLPLPHIGIEVTSAIAAFIVAAHTDHLAMLPWPYTRHSGVADLLERITVKETLEAHAICLVTRSPFPLTPAAEFLSDLIRRSAIHHRC